MRIMTRATVVSFRPARPLDVATGLLGYARVQVGDLVVDSVAIRRARDGRHLISLPSRRDRGGVEHTLIAPASSAIGRDIEAQVLAALRARGELP
jgi:DNA-binding cell septation regulator SpoVG